MEAELSNTEVQGSNGVGVPQENVDTNTDETRNTMEITDQSVLQTENAQQQQDLEDDAGDVVFICMHGQAFQCKPQVGIPIKEFKRKSMHTEGCCSCSKFPNITGEVQHGDDKNRKFACNECGKKFSPKAFADHSRPIQNNKDKSDTNGANVDTTTQQSTEKIDHNLDPSTTCQQNQPQVRQNPHLSCQECGKAFTRQRALSIHMKQHKKKLDSSKEKDNVKKTSQSEIVPPRRLQLPPHDDHLSYCQMQSYACEECPKVFNRLNKLRQHKKTHLNTKNQSDTEEPKELSCVKCSKVFSQPDILKKHELQHTKVAGKDIMCVLCLETFDDQIVYKAHEKKHLKKNKSNEMKCEVCQKVFKGLSTLQRHTEIHNTEDQIACRLGCNQSFASSLDRKKHEVRYCKMGEKFLCSFCGEVFCNKYQFQIHKAKFHSLDEHRRKPKKNKYQCSYCNQVFGILTAFKRHERIHTNEKPFKCRFCSKTFLQRDYLSCHERVHTKERPFQCEVCGRSFSQDVHRRTHMRVHTKERPYQCQTCGKSFSHSSTLKLHEKTHVNPRRRARKPGEIFQYRRSIRSGEKIHVNKCQYCGRTFTHFQNLIAHERIHTKEKPFECDVCAKTFTQHSHLQTHKLVHTGEKPHKCKICGRAFALKGNCRAHEKTHDKTTCSSRVRKTAPRSALKTSEGTAAQISNNQELSEDDTLTQDVQGEEVTVQVHEVEVEQRITVQHSEEDVQGTAIILQLLESTW